MHSIDVRVHATSIHFRTFVPPLPGGESERRKEVYNKKLSFSTATNSGFAYFYQFLHLHTYNPGTSGSRPLRHRLSSQPRKSIRPFSRSPSLSFPLDPTLMYGPSFSKAQMMEMMLPSCRAYRICPPVTAMRLLRDTFNDDVELAGSREQGAGSKGMLQYSRLSYLSFLFDATVP
jgi:hypothetical protein